MNINETNQMKERIDSVLESATKFGNQAELLRSTRETLTEYINQAKALNEHLVEVTAKAFSLFEETESLSRAKVSGRKP